MIVIGQFDPSVKEYTCVQERPEDDSTFVCYPDTQKQEAKVPEMNRQSDCKAKPSANQYLIQDQVPPGSYQIQMDPKTGISYLHVPAGRHDDNLKVMRHF